MRPSTSSTNGSRGWLPIYQQFHSVARVVRARGREVALHERVVVEQLRDRDFLQVRHPVGDAGDVAPRLLRSVVVWLEVVVPQKELPSLLADLRRRPERPSVRVDRGDAARRAIGRAHELETEGAARSEERDLSDEALALRAANVVIFVDELGATQRLPRRVFR